MTDEIKLSLALKSKDPKRLETTFNYLFDKYKNLVLFVASSYLKSEEDALDVTQDTFINFINNANYVVNNIKSYLTKTARNLSLNLLKKQQRIVLVDDENELSYLNNLDELNHNDDFISLLRVMKTELDEEEIKIIFMHLIFGYTFNEIAKMIHLNEKTIKTKYYRAIKRINKLGGI